ncbi:MAG: amidohydrolase, partial [Rhodoferax sp.]|nr:amidohydrolase [Rhodoferax sp.]
ALDICISHGGGATALLMGRMAKAARKRPWAAAAMRPEGAFEERLRRLWFDTHVEHPQALDLLARAVGTDHLVYGTNFAGWDEPDPESAVTSYQHDHAQLSRNAKRLLRADSATPDTDLGNER